MNVHGNGLWSYDPENKAIYAGESDTIVVYENGLQFETDGPLIVACVNALAGVEDPADFVKRAKLALCALGQAQR